MIRGQYTLDKQIIIPINLFTLDQTIYIATDSEVKEFTKTDFAHLPEVIVELANVQDVNNIKIIGNKNYSEAVANEIKEYNLKNYGFKELNITIMEG